jgi:hypothetical protein
MAIAVATTRQTLADAYKAIGNFVALATADPGTSATPSNEATGGSYARVATTWTSSTGGVVNGSAVTINAAAATYTFAFLATAVSGNNMFDKCSITSTTLSSAGQIIVTPSFTQS